MKTLDYREITSIVCEYFNIKKENLFVKGRHRELVMIRQFNYYMIRKFTNLSLSQIANKSTGADYNFKQDHATVIHSINTIEDLRSFDKLVNANCVSIELLINEFINSDDIEYIKVSLIRRIKYSYNLKDLIAVLTSEKKLLNTNKNESNS
jgi:hypothetical protein